jgi:ADP-ribosylglycohydrolase
VFAVAVAHAVRTGETPRQVWQAALDWGTSRKVAPSILEALQGAEQSPPREYFRQMGWVLIALRNAFYQLLSAPSAEAGLVDTVRRGGDTDTNGAIAGALLGAVHGGRSLPLRWTRSVHSCRPLANAKPRPREYWPVDAAVLAEALVLCGRR